MTHAATGDGPEDMLGSYVPGRHDITNSMITLNGNAFTPQKMRLVADVPEEAGIKEVKFTLHGISRHPGFCENATAPSGTGPGDDDFSFHPTANSTLAIAAVTNGTAAADFYCKDYGGRCTVIAQFITTDNTVFSTVIKEVPIDTGWNGIADAWEQHWVELNNDENAFHPVVWTPELFQDTGWDGETAELGWQHYAFGYTHASGGDGLTVWQEYRGYIVDGGPGFTGTRHVSLSPFRKELLVQVNELPGMAGQPSFNPNNALATYDFNTVMQQVVDFYGDMSRGLGIDLYWVRKDFTVFGDALSPDNLPPVPYAYRFAGELLPSLPVNPNALPSAQTQVLRDLRLRPGSPYQSPWNTHLAQTHYPNSLLPGHFIKQSRAPALEQFVKLVLFDRMGYVGINTSNTNGGTISLMGQNAMTEFNGTDPEMEGSRINVVAMAEEGVGMRHYSPQEFLNQLVWAVAHELGHLLIGPIHDMSNPNALMTNSNPTPHGISFITATQWDISNINFQKRRSIRQQ